MAWHSHGRGTMSLRVELINTGSELLLGTVRDAHLSWFGKELFPLGLRINRQMTVPDGAPIRDALLESFGRTDVLIVTGGLGPTTDDISRELAAELLGRKMIPHPETLERIRERCRVRGFAFQPRMERQAMVPEGAIVLPNDNGTAPGLYFPAVEGISWSSPHIFLLPGPPREMQPIARAHLLPKLEELVGQSPENVRKECRIYKVVGMGESMVESAIGLKLSERTDLEVGYCARPNEVDFRVIGSKEVLDEVEPSVLAIVGDYLVSRDEESMEEVIVHLLSRRHETVVTAESCTGGLLACRLTNVPGASAVFLEGFIVYSNESKSELLGVSPELISDHGAVSGEVVLSMAEGALRRSGASYALATTGIAGPGGGTLEKPVGTVWLALSAQGQETEVWKETIPTDRLTFKQVVTQSILDRLRKRLQAMNHHHHE